MATSHVLPIGQANGVVPLLLPVIAAVHMHLVVQMEIILHSLSGGGLATNRCQTFEPIIGYRAHGDGLSILSGNVWHIARRIVLVHLRHVKLGAQVDFVLVRSSCDDVLAGARTLLVLHEFRFSVSHYLLVETSTVHETGSAVATRRLTQLRAEVGVAKRARFDVARGDGGLLQHVSRIASDGSSVITLLLMSSSARTGASDSIQLRLGFVATCGHGRRGKLSRRTSLVIWRGCRLSLTSIGVGLRRGSILVV